MRARSNLWDYPTEANMLVHRRRGHIGEKLTVLDQSNAGLIAGRLDPQDQGGRIWVSRSHAQ